MKGGGVRRRIIGGGRRRQKGVFRLEKTERHGYNISFDIGFGRKFECCIFMEGNFKNIVAFFDQINLRGI